MPASSWARSSAYMRDSPSEAASRPALPARGRAGRCRRRGRCVARRSSGSVREPELLDHDVEGAGLAAVAPEHVLDVERRRAEPLRDGRDLGRRHEQEHGCRIDEAADQPGAGDAVDLGPRARHPDRAAAAVARRQLGRGHQRQPGLPPSLEPACQRSRPATPAWRSQAAAPSLSFCPRWQTTTAVLPANSAAHADAESMRAAHRARESGGDRRRSPPRCGHRSPPGTSACRSGGRASRWQIVVIDDMLRPPVGGGTRFFGMSPRGEIASPYGHK